MRNLYKELVEEFGREKQVLTAEEWFDIKAYGTYEMDYKNGELWSFNSKLYLLEFIHLPLTEKTTIIKAYE